MPGWLRRLESTLSSRLISRRYFLSGGAFLLGTDGMYLRSAHGSRLRSFPELVPNGYTIWYNRPAAIDTPIGTFIASVSNIGEAQLTLVRNGRPQSRRTIMRYPTVSDHGSPVIEMSERHLVVGMANHSSPLYVGRVDIENFAEASITPTLIDHRRCTYPSILKLTSAELLLFYTIEERSTTDYLSSNRQYVFRKSLDGGQSWSETFEVINKEPGLYPYPTSPFLDTSHRIWIAYSMLRIAPDYMHPTEDLFLISSSDFGRSWDRHPDSRPLWHSPRGNMFQVFDSCDFGKFVRTGCLYADGAWGKSWTRVDAYIIDLPKVGREVPRPLRIPGGVSWSQYPHGICLNRMYPNEVFLAQSWNGSNAISRFDVSSGHAVRDVVYRGWGELAFPFQNQPGGVIYAHSGYRSQSTSQFSSSIIELER